jgi:hypothetical protein
VTKYDAQAGREVSTDADMTRAQVVSDEVDLADGMQGVFGTGDRRTEPR